MKNHRRHYKISDRTEWAKEPKDTRRDLESAVHYRVSNPYYDEEHVIYIWDNDFKLILSLDVTHELKELWCYHWNSKSIARDLELIICAEAKRAGIEL